MPNIYSITRLCKKKILPKGNIDFLLTIVIAHLTLVNTATVFIELVGRCTIAGRWPG
jgi:hypothetical protein